MNKKRFFTTMIGLAFSITGFCQQATPAVNPNAEHDRMYRILNASSAIEVPVFVMDKLKIFAQQKGYNVPAVLRNAILFKPLYNTALTKEDRTFASSMLTRISEISNPTIPADLVTEIIKATSKN